jgi:alkanesulfonate monooxygenase SsuD/methylene tetrahydromethanopterin reductase-like flavin-dependent oxidoreductase (luciferase family)
LAIDGPRTLVVGEEHDERLLAALDAVLRDPETRLISDTHAHLGSQDLNEVEFERHGRRVRVEIETFMGFSITGEPETIAEAVAALNDHGADIVVEDLG